MLSKRLNTVLSFIDRSDILADIGTDHGYLIKKALEKGVSFAQGVENKSGPFNRATLNLETEINSGRCILSLSSGLDNLDDTIDTVVISGMGGELIARIIDENLATAQKMKKLILAPNIKNFELRKYLSNHYFVISNETIIKEENHFYEIIVASYSKDKVELSNVDCLFGPCLLKEKSPLFKEKWMTKLNKYNQIIKSSNQEINQLENLISQIKEVLYG